MALFKHNQARNAAPYANPKMKPLIYDNWNMAKLMQNIY